jgi:type IV pilus assembly protein PilC
VPNYNYLALNNEGKSFKGVMNALNDDDLEYKLSEISLELVSSNLSSQSSAVISFFGQGVSNRDVILLCTHFEQLDRAGVPLTLAIEDLRDSSDTQVFRDMMQGIYETVKSGKLLSEALAEYPKVFNDVFVGLVAAGEKTGTLHQSFAYLADHLKWSEDIRRSTMKAIRYPLFLLVVLFSVISVMMIYVIPKLSEFLINQNIELPLYTKALIWFSNFFQNYWYVLIIVPISLYILNKVARVSSQSYAYMVDRVKLGFPVIGKTLRKIDVARFSEFFMITFKSGIDVMNCLDIAQKVIKNRVIKESVGEIRQEISEGSSISKALKNSEEFPSLVVRMFEVGEQTGNMGQALSNVKYFYDREVKDASEKLVSFVQPTLTIIMGGLLLWISLSVFGPLYSSFGNVR